MSSHIIELTNEENNIFIDLALKINATPDNPQLFFIRSKECSKYIPERLKNLLIKFAKEGSEKGFLLIKNVLYETANSQFRNLCIKILKV